MDQKIRWGSLRKIHLKGVASLVPLICVPLWTPIFTSVLYPKYYSKNENLLNLQSLITIFIYLSITKYCLYLIDLDIVVFEASWESDERRYLSIYNNIKSFFHNFIFYGTIGPWPIIEPLFAIIWYFCNLVFGHGSFWAVIFLCLYSLMKSLPRLDSERGISFSFVFIGLLVFSAGALEMIISLHRQGLATFVFLIALSTYIQFGKSRNKTVNCILIASVLIHISAGFFVFAFLLLRGIKQLNLIFTVLCAVFLYFVVQFFISKTGVYSYYTLESLNFSISVSFVFGLFTFVLFFDCVPIKIRSFFYFCCIIYLLGQSVESGAIVRLSYTAGMFSFWLILIGYWSNFNKGKLRSYQKIMFSLIFTSTVFLRSMSSSGAWYYWGFNDFIYNSI